MKKYGSLILHLVLLVIVVVELTGRFTDSIRLEFMVKPLIMIWMAVFFLLFRDKGGVLFPVLAAFFFSWTGDILLMFSSSVELSTSSSELSSSSGELLFYAGVGGFFLAQLSYIYIFLTYSEYGGRGYLRRHPALVLPFLAYLAGIYGLLYPKLDALMKGVILVYALSLIGMSMMALNRRDRVARASYLLVFTGSLLFVASDSMIAIDKFHTEFRLAGFWIMVTYIAAQYLIMQGLTRTVLTRSGT
jgi:uncharacterized membrane protein YhhN